MDATPLIGIALYALGGLAGACFYLPFKGVKQWAWESYWMVYAIMGLIVVPWGLAFIFSPNVLTVLHQASWKTLMLCFIFGAMWGVGGLTWGLMIRYLGVGLGLAVGAGLCASAGTLIPPLAQGQFGGLLAESSGIATLLGVAVAVVGIILTGAAGMSKESELSEEQKKATVAEFNFPRGILVAIFSGIMSAGMAFGLGGGAEIEKAALITAPYTPVLWKGMPVLVVVLLGGFAVNFLWCLFLNAKNRTGGDYVKPAAPLVANVLLAGAAGAIWCSQFALLKMADSKIQELAFAGWTVLMSSMIIFSTILGILLHEWRGVSARTKALLGASLLVLVASLVVIGYGNYLKPTVTEGAVVKVDASQLVIRTGDGEEKSIPLSATSEFLVGGKAGKAADLKASDQVKVIQSRVAPLKIEVSPAASGPAR